MKGLTKVPFLITMELNMQFGKGLQMTDTIMASTAHLWEKFAGGASEEDSQRIEEKLPFMKKGPIKKVWDKVLLLRKLVKDPKAAWGAKAAAIGALLYLISPADAVPDVIPGGGLLDDVAVLMIACKMLADELKKYVEDTTIIKTKGHYKIVRASVLGSIIIAGVVLILKLI